MASAPSERMVPRLESDDTLQMYLDYIGQFDLLRAEEEVDLAQRMEAGSYAAILLGLQQDPDITNEIVLRSLGKSREMSHEARTLALKQMVDHPALAEREALLTLADDGSLARKMLAEANLRLPVFFAARYVHSGQPLQEMIADGNIGLARAVDKFDYRQGYKFSTYAACWIRKYITQGLKDTYYDYDDEIVLLGNYAISERAESFEGAKAGWFPISTLWPERERDTSGAPSHPELVHLLNQVPEDTRQILTMRLVDRRTVADISEQTGLSAGKINHIVRTVTAQLQAAAG